MHRAVLVGSRALFALGVALAFMSVLFVVVQIAMPEPAAAMSLAGNDLSVTTAITTTARRDIVLLLDNSRSMVEEYDRDAKSYGFARFLVRLLQTFAREESSVAVMRFAATVSDTLPTGVEPLVDLSPVDLWSRGDFLAVKPGKCPQPGQAGYRVPGRDPCFGTRFAAAFREAGAVLRDCTNTGPASQCAIVMFTDGDLRDPNDVVDSPEEIAQALKNLPPGVRVYMILFGGRNAAEPASSGYWKSWREPNGRINDWFFNATTAKRDEVYNAVLRMLGMEEILAGLRAVPLPTVGETVVQDLPLNVDRLELNLLPDVEVTETFTASWGTRPVDMAAAVTTEPDVDEGTRRIWLAPTFDALTMSLAGGEGVAYYRVVTRTVPVQARVTVWPTEVAVGQPVQVQALVSAGGRVLSDSRKIRVIPLMWPDGRVLADLQVRPEGIWTGSLEITRSGEYSLTVDVKQNSQSSFSSELLISPAVFTVSKTRFIAQARVWPEKQWVGRPVQFEAVLLSDGNLVRALPSSSSPAILIQPGGMRYPLNQHSDGIWRTDQLVRIATPDNYKADVVVAGWDSAETKPAFFTILALPELKMEVTPLEAAPGSDVKVNLWATDMYTPTLRQRVETGWTRVELNRLEGNQYSTRIPMPATGNLILAANLEDFPEQEPQVAVVRQTPVSADRRALVVRHVPRVGIPVLLLILVVITVLVTFKRRKMYRSEILIAEIIEDQNRWDELRNLSVQENWGLVDALAAYVRDDESGQAQQKGEQPDAQNS